MNISATEKQIPDARAVRRQIKVVMELFGMMKLI